MAYNLNINDLDIKKFHGYTVYIQDNIVIYECFGTNVTEETKYVKDLFDNIQLAAIIMYNEKTGNRKNFMENKSAFEVVHKKSGARLYVWQFDGRYGIGLTAIPHETCHSCFNFETMEYEKN